MILTWSCVSNILLRDEETPPRSECLRSTSASRLRLNSAQKISCWLAKSMMLCSILVNSVARNCWNSVLSELTWEFDLESFSCYLGEIN